MRLDALIRELTAMAAAGYGNRRVIDNNGNDVAGVEPPFAQPSEDLPADDDECSIQLACRVEHEEGR